MYIYIFSLEILSPHVRDNFRFLLDVSNNLSVIIIVITSLNIQDFGTKNIQNTASFVVLVL